MGFVLFGLIAGAGIPVQTAVNTRLRGKYGGSVFHAARYSFSSSLVMLFVILGISGIGYAMPWDALSREPLWIWVGGVCGIYYLTCNTILMPHLGSVQTVLFPIVGQVLMGITIDHFGFFRAQVNPLTPVRLVGAALVLAGAIVISVARASAGTKPAADGTGGAGTKSGATAQPESGAKPESGVKSGGAKSGGAALWLWRLLGVTIGFAGAIQTAVNSQLGRVLGASLKATTISFFIGTICIWIVCLVHVLRNGKPETSPGFSPWWMWTGGTYGIVYNLAGIVLGNRFGPGLAVLIVLTGTISGGALVDQFGLFGVRHQPMTVLKVGCILMMLAGLAMIRLL